MVRQVEGGDVPEIYLPAGALVSCSTEDYELAADPPWRLWTRKGISMAVRDARSRGRRFRLLLHREVAFQVHPELVREPARMSVKPLNGNFLDVRRENLEITIKPRTRGGSRRPAGHRAREYRGERAGKPPPPWSRSAASGNPLLND